MRVMPSMRHAPVCLISLRPSLRILHLSLPSSTSSSLTFTSSSIWIVLELNTLCASANEESGPLVNNAPFTVLPTSVRKVGVGNKKFVRSWRALKDWTKRAPTRSRRPPPRVICSGVCWGMTRNKKPLMAVHVLMTVVTYCRPGELLQSVREDLSHCTSTPFNEACQAKHRVTTTQWT